MTRQATTPGRAYEHVQRKLTEQERGALRESLAAHGLRDEITLDQHGDILDGYNREDLCIELGIEPRYRTLEVADPKHWIRHNQTARRNLTEKEMREMIIEAKTADPAASTRTIAKKLGVSPSHVSKTLSKSGASTEAPVKGRDGKTYTMQPKVAPKRGTSKAAGKYQQTRAAVRGSLATGQAVNAKAVAEAQGVSVDTVERAALAEQARIDALEELYVDPATLSASAQAKLEVAKRQIEKKLSMEHAKRMAGLDEEVRLRLLDDTKERLAWMQKAQEEAASTEKLYRKWIGDATPIFTEAEYFTILKALDPSIEHRLVKPDPDLVRLFNQATVLLNGQRDRLTLRKKS